MAGIVLVEETRNKKPWCLLAAVITNGRLYITRIDFQEWELNRRNGQVEISYIFDENNTRKFMTQLKESECEKFLKKLKARFSGGSGIIVMTDIEKFCKNHDISYDYSVWY